MMGKVIFLVFYFKMNQTPLNRSRNDKFLLVLELPKALKNTYDVVLEKSYKIDPIQFSVFGSPVPAISVPDVSVAFGGQVHKTSSFSRPAYNPITLRFLVDNGYTNYWTLWKWLNLFNDSKTSSSPVVSPLHPSYDKSTPAILTNSLIDYVSHFSLFSMDEYNNKIVEFKYTNVFPTNLGEINYSNQDPSEINCNVTFSFNQLNVNLLRDVNKVSC